MKNLVINFVLLFSFSPLGIQAQQISAVGLQWSSSRMDHNVFFEDFHMASEASFYSFIRWGSYLSFIPEIGIRQQNQTLIINPGEQTKNRIRFGHAKLSMMFPFKKAFHETRKGCFASIGFSQNVLFNFRQEVWENDDMLSRTNVFASANEGDVHIGVGYIRPISAYLNLLLRGEYGVGLIGGRDWRRDELSLSLGLGFQLEKP